MTSVLRRAVHAALAVNGLAATAPAPTPARRSLRAAVRGDRTPAPAAARPDRVVVLGLPGVLVRARDGRLPRDGEVQPDGACLRFAAKGGPVLVAGALRRSPAPGTCRWAAPSELHPVDLEVVRAVAPGQVAEHDARRRVANLVATLARAHGAEPSGDPETDLCTLIASYQLDAAAVVPTLTA